MLLAVLKRLYDCTTPSLRLAYQCALSNVVFSIPNISVDAVVDRCVSNGISGAQRRESEFLRELTSIIETEYYVCRLLFCQSDIAALMEHVCFS